MAERRHPLPSTEDTFPESIGPYVPTRLLGQGGMAAVYLCTGPDGRLLAVKWLDRATPRITLRFEREAKVLSRLDHPNIVRFFDVGTQAGRPWMAMQYVEGQDLRVYAARLRQRPPAERFREVQRIGMALCDALSAVHELDLVHRDLKPANVLLDKDLRPVLTDFGVVKDLDDDDKTAMGVLVGTTGYAAPEQIRGDAVDHRTDLYGLGCTLYYLLTQQRPYPSKERAEVVQAHLRAPVPRPSAHDPQVPPSLEAAIMRLMAKDPGDRYPDARAAKAALQVGSEGVAPPPLAGRNRYVEAVTAILDRGQGGVIRAEGPIGSGRRWLLQVIEDLARKREIPVLIATDVATLHAGLARLAAGERLVVGTRLPVPPGTTVDLIRLEPLSLADVRRTLVSVAPATEAPHVVSERLHRATGGHPRWLLPLLESVREGNKVVLPESLDAPSELRSSVLDLPFEALETLGALALLGVPADANLIEQITQVPADETLPALLELGLANHEDGRWSIVGELTAELARAALPDPVAVHRRAAAALARRPGMAWRAARHAEAAGDPVAAVTRPSPAALLAEAEAQHLAGRSREALALVFTLVADARSASDREAELPALLSAGLIALEQGQFRQAENTLADAAALARALDRQPERRAAHVLRAMAILEGSGDPLSSAAAALDRLQHALTRVEQGQGWVVLAHAVRARANALLGDRRTGQKALDEALAGVGGLEPTLKVRTTLELARAARELGDLAAAERLAGEAAATAAALGWSLLERKARALG